jgi:hypothetical protein
MSMVEINLLPWRQEARLYWRRRRWALTLLSGLLLGLVLVNQFFLPPALVPVLADLPEQKSITQPASQYVGYLHQGERTWGLLMFADGIIRDVQVHDYVPEINAHVLALNEKKLQLVYANHQFSSLTMTHS